MRVFTIVAAVAALAIGTSTVGAQSPAQLYQRASELERAHGKLDSAIMLYQRVVDRAGTNRPLAARALLRLGAAYELLGRTEARATYTRLLRDFGEQDEATEARRRLTELEGSGVATQVGESRGLRMRALWTGADVPAQAAVSADGGTLVFTDWTTGDLAKRDLARGVSERLTNKGTWERSSSFAEAAIISPDGRRVAYSFFTDSGLYELRLVPMAGGLSQTIPLPPMYYVLPYAWMPDGKAVLAALKPRDGPGDTATLAIVALDGNVRRVSTINWRWTSGASVSPDGSWIVFDDADHASGQRDVRIVHVDGTRTSSLVSHPAHDWSPMWTPDGRSVAFLSDRTGAWVLMAVDVSDGKPSGSTRVIKADFGGNQPFGFTRSGGFVYGPQRPSSDIMVADLDIDAATISQPRAVTRSFVGRNQFPVWSPNGATLGFISVRGTGTGLPGERTLVTVDLATGVQREFAGALAYLLRARWNADGRTILLAGRRRVEDSKGSIYALDPATGAVEPMPAPADFSTFEVARAGTAMLYTRADTAMGALRRFTFADRRDELIFRVEGFGRIAAAAESPDGAQIAVTAIERQGTDGARTVTHILSSDGAIVRSLPNVAATGYYQLAWSPDGRYLIGISDREAGKNIRVLWRIPVDGSNATRFNLDGRIISTFRLTADGKRAAMVMDDPTQSAPAIWIVENLVPPAASRPSR